MGVYPLPFLFNLIADIMIIFDQLRLSDDAQKMYINAHVNKALDSNNIELFKDIYIESVTIITADKVSESNPYEPTKDYIYKKTFDDNVKSIDLVLTPNDFTRSWETDVKAMHFSKSDMSDTLFFVYIKCKGTIGECVPCRMDELTTVGVTFDEKMLYQMVMGYTKELSDDCTIHRGFTDFILRWNAFKAAIETEHYIEAIKFWNMLFDNGNTTAYISNCNCRK